jgi:predicted DNA-binding transcriptional regulator YafY
MRKADRLFQLVQYLRKRRRAVTANTIAEHFGINVRTVYRDLQVLKDSGVPIQGAAGIGYLFDKSYELPPLLFNAEELEALTLGAGMVSNWTDELFAVRAQSALAKIEAVLPEPLQARLQQHVVMSQPSQAKPAWGLNFSTIRDAIHRKHYLRYRYLDEQDRATQRRVRPLGLVFFGPVWLLLAWCELRRDFRTFRLDRIKQLQVEEGRFADEPGRGLQDYIGVQSE